MAGPRRAPAPPPPAAVGVNFGSLGFYSGGFTLPKGRYALEFIIKMHQPTNQQTGQLMGKARLGVLLTAYPFNPDGTIGEGVDQFLSMGSKADQSFAPDPVTAKSLVEVPGAPASTAPRNTNWNLFLKSLYDCGLPEGIFTNDITVIDGVWVQTDLVPEPEERKGYGQAKTGEAADTEEKRQGSGLVPIVVEILEGGKPWEGGGGFPTAAVTAPVATRPAAAPAARVAPRAAAVAAPAPPPADAAGEDDVLTAAINGATAVLEKEPDGTTKLKLRTGTFKAVTAASGGEVAQAVMDTYFATDDALNTVLGQLGYKVVGTAVKPA